MEPLGRRIARALTSLSIAGLCAAAIAAILPIWPLELFDHFRVHYVALGLLAIGGALALRLRGYFDAALIVTIIHFCSLLPSAPQSAMPARGTPLRILVLNVHTSSSSFEAVRELIADTRPDVLGLVEVDDRWLEALAPALVDFPGRIEHTRDDNFGIALYARGKVIGDVELLGSTLPTIVANVAVGSASLGVIVTHPIPPVSGALSSALESQLDAVAVRARGMSHAVVMGDFNATPWSRAFRSFLARSGLCDSRDGHGLQPTFPASTWILRIPIDHVLMDCAIGVRDRRVERDVGSDHLPVVVDVVVPL